MQTLTRRASATQEDSNGTIMQISYLLPKASLHVQCISMNLLVGSFTIEKFSTTAFQYSKKIPHKTASALQYAQFHVTTAQQESTLSSIDEIPYSDTFPSFVMESIGEIGESFEEKDITHGERNDNSE